MEKESINLKDKKEKEILDAYAKLSDETLELYELLKRNKDKQQALKQYEQIKLVKKRSQQNG
ncbi:MAG: hypothetical protein IKQ29_02955 [Bacilli bacterium]|nr:hypothetical protein [Bacilli bacterium]